MINDPKIELWVEDEVYFQQHGTTCKMWVAPEEINPAVYHNPVRNGAKYFGAVRIRDGKFVYLRELGKFNGDTFFTYLKFLRKITARSSKKIVLLLDNASYHRSKVHKEWRDACSDKFSLEFLPPYSPELSPIERLWKYTRRICTHNRYFPTLDDLAATIEPQFDRWRYGSEELQSFIWSSKFRIRYLIRLESYFMGCSTRSLNILSPKNCT